jgi:hypothetical protein
MHKDQPSSGKEFRARNHYVPGLYLKRWGNNGERVCTYRLLVAHENAAQWQTRTIKGLAYHRHLYTRVLAAGETDEIERWLDEKFESPAEAAISKVVSDARMHRDDWSCLARFLAAQDVRTPARLMEMFKRWEKDVPALLQSTLEESVLELTEARRNGTTPAVTACTADAEYFPARVTKEIQPGAGTGVLKVETVLGRGLYLFALRRLLSETSRVLEQHRWTILRPPAGMKWMTSDDPVIKLNYYGDRYDFKGGWGSKGTELLLPLSPDHLLYTKIGERPPERGSRLPTAKADEMQRMFVEHAHRFVFAMHPVPSVSVIRPRKVDADLLQNEADQWSRWHDEQVNAERILLK